jgi:hypothetical protein
MGAQAFEWATFSCVVPGLPPSICRARKNPATELKKKCVGFTARAHIQAPRAAYKGFDGRRLYDNGRLLRNDGASRRAWNPRFRAKSFAQQVESPSVPRRYAAARQVKSEQPANPPRSAGRWVLTKADSADSRASSRPKKDPFRICRSLRDPSRLRRLEVDASAVSL